MRNTQFSESFSARIVVFAFDSQWWFGTAEVAVPTDALRQYAAKERIVARIECPDFVGDVVVTSFLVMDDIAVLQFVGITKPPGQ